MQSEKDLNILEYAEVYVDATTIKLHHETKSKLDTFREYKNESYDEVISKLIHIVKNPSLSKATLKAIEEARARYKRGIYVNEKEARRRLGL